MRRVSRAPSARAHVLVPVGFLSFFCLKGDRLLVMFVAVGLCCVQRQGPGPRNRYPCLGSRSRGRLRSVRSDRCPPPPPLSTPRSPPPPRNGTGAPFSTCLSPQSSLTGFKWVSFSALSLKRPAPYAVADHFYVWQRSRATNTLNKW